MQNQFLTNYTDITFLEKIKDNLRRCTAFSFSVSFIKKAGLVLLFKDIGLIVEETIKDLFKRVRIDTWTTTNIYNKKGKIAVSTENHDWEVVW